MKTLILFLFFTIGAAGQEAITLTQEQLDNPTAGFQPMPKLHAFDKKCHCEKGFTRPVKVKGHWRNTKKYGRIWISRHCREVRVKTPK